MRSWEDLNAESERVIDQAMEEAAAYASGCTCGATDVVGASHLDWCAIVVEPVSPTKPTGGER